MLKQAAATALMVFATAPSQAQDQNCGPREAIVARLADGFGEGQQMIGLAANGAIIEVFGNPETGSWTLLLSRADGISCLMAAGEYFQNIAQQPQGTVY